MLTRRSLITTGLVAGLCAGSHRASAETAPLLEVSGKLQRPDGRSRCAYSLADLDKLGNTAFTAHTPWYPDACRFEGVLLSRLMDDAGGHGTTLRVSALNDYAADIPFADLATFKPILASRRNGEIMPISDKGPLFVVYPFDAIPSLQHQSFYSRRSYRVSCCSFVGCSAADGG